MTIQDKIKKLNNRFPNTRAARLLESIVHQLDSHKEYYDKTRNELYENIGKRAASSYLHCSYRELARSERMFVHAKNILQMLEMDDHNLYGCVNETIKFIKDKMYPKVDIPSTTSRFSDAIEFEYIEADQEFYGKRNSTNIAQQILKLLTQIQEDLQELKYKG